MDWSSPHGAYGATDPLFLLLVALAMEAYLGDRPLIGRLGHPRRAMARLARWLEDRLNRPRRGERALLVRGGIVALFLVLVAILVGTAVALFTRHYPFAWILEAFLLMLLVSQRGTWTRVQAVRTALDDGSLIRARQALPALVEGALTPQELDRLDRDAVLRWTLAGLGGRFADYLVTPVFWYALLDLPGLLAQQTLAVAAIGLGRSAGTFGLPVRRLHLAVVLVPDRLSGLLLAVAAAFVPGVRPGTALRGLSGNRRWPVAALQGALDLPAAGPLGIGLGGAVLGRALAVFAVGCLLTAGLIALLALLRLAV